MSDEPKTLRDAEEITSEATFDSPNILLSYSRDNGHDVLTVRGARSQQVQMTTRLEWSESPVETPPLLVIRAQNIINFAGQRLPVLNDNTSLGDKPLPPSAPTAREYLDQIGKTVTLQFSCQRDDLESRRLERPVYKIVRNTITIP